MLLSQHGVGSYLVRHSEHYPGDFTLSVVPPTPVGKDNVQHYRIKIIEGKGLTVDDEEYFKSLEDLIQVNSLLYAYSKDDKNCVL